MGMKEKFDRSHLDIMGEVTIGEVLETFSELRDTTQTKLSCRLGFHKRKAGRCFEELRPDGSKRLYVMMVCRKPYCYDFHYRLLGETEATREDS